MPQPILWTRLDENGEEIEISIPTIFQVCSGCNGEGKHVNRDVDAHGISPQEFADDPDFEEDYFSGVYDVVCDTCHGQRVEAVPNWGAMSPELRKLYEKHLEDEAAYQRMCAAERRFAGWY